MPIDPELLAALQARMAAQRPAADLAAMRAGFAATGASLPRPPDIAVEDRQVPGPGGAIPVRLYRPRGALPGGPLLIFLHGGGWMFGDLDSHDAACMHLAAQAGCAVAAVAYRLAP
uniref:alpha/beta hydrolase fold domain-containing protein n=1 Tax=Pelomonas sp. KK5 TaxID=1855730 RepID=UPI001301C012